MGSGLHDSGSGLPQFAQHPHTAPCYSHRLHSLGHMDCTCCWSGGVSLFLMQSGTHRLETFLLFSAVLKTSPMNSTWKWILWILWSGSKESNLKVFSISQTEMPSNIFFLVSYNKYKWQNNEANLMKAQDCGGLALRPISLPSHCVIMRKSRGDPDLLSEWRFPHIKNVGICLNLKKQNGLL